MHRGNTLGILGMLLLGACAAPSRPASRERAPGALRTPADAAQAASPDAGPSSVDASTNEEPEIGSAEDGNDETEQRGEGKAPLTGIFTPVGRTLYSLDRICDLTAFGDSLYLAHARRPLDWDGATIQRYTEGETIKLAFNWNRVGEPSKGGGGGQGFLRVHRIDGRLFVPDADPPYAGFGLKDYGTEGYVFLSSRDGVFAPPTQPHARPPGLPDADGKAGAAILPRAYHVLDTIKYRGHLYASTGSVPPKERAWSGPSPGALHLADETLQTWTYKVGYPVPYKDGVYRLTYMVRFRGRLYAGIQDYDGIDTNAYVVFEPPKERDIIEQGDLRAVSLGRGRVNTLKWYVDPGPDSKKLHTALYWLTLEGGIVHLRRTDDGDTWNEVPLPASMGRPNDILRFRDGLFVLGENELVRIDGKEPQVVAAVPSVGSGKKTTSTFALTDLFCQAPLAVYRNKLYAGGQKDGTLYRFDEAAVATP